MTDTMLTRMARAIDPEAWGDFSGEPSVVQARAAAKREMSLWLAKAALQQVYFEASELPRLDHDEAGAYLSDDGDFMRVSDVLAILQGEE